MAYVTQNDFINEISEAELAELTGDSTGTTVDSGKLDKAIFDAENLVNGYCSNRYSVPFAAPDIPSLIKTITLELALVNLRKARNFHNEQIEVDYDRNMRLLRDIQKGVIGLGLDADGNVTGTAAKPSTEIQTKGRIFGRPE